MRSAGNAKMKALINQFAEQNKCNVIWMEPDDDHAGPAAGGVFGGYGAMPVMWPMPIRSIFLPVGGKRRRGAAAVKRSPKPRKLIAAAPARSRGASGSRGRGRGTVVAAAPLPEDDEPEDDDDEDDDDEDYEDRDEDAEEEEEEDEGFEDVDE